MLKAQEIIAAIEDASSRWVCCDWTHERRDEGGVVYDDDDDVVYCEGGHADKCSYCAEADEAAEAAAEYGRDAIVALRRGDVADASEAIEQAVALENEWGDSPVWGPVAKLFADR